MGKVKGDLEEQLVNEPIELFLLNDVHNLFKKLKKFPDKLKKMLEKMKLLVMVSSPKLSSLGNDTDLHKELIALPVLDEKSAVLVVQHITNEMKKRSGNLLLISENEQCGAGDFFKGAESFSNMMESSEAIANWIAG